MAANILVLGDECWMAKSLQAALGQSGYRLITSPTQAAEEAIHHHRPALIIACMSGYKTADLDLIRRLFNLGGRAPIIAIGSPQETECQLAAFEAGVDDYLIRPLNLQVLVARMRAILRRRSWTPIPSKRDTVES